MNYSKIITTNIIFILRQLNNEETSTFNKTSNNDTQKEQLRDLYIYIAVLVVIIISILGGYALYRKCVEKRALQEIEREYQLMIMNLLNSASSQLSSSHEDKRPHSYNNINPNYIQNYINEIGIQNNDNSIDFNYEERMEKIRKKFGNSIVIKCLLKKQIEEIQYTKNIGEDIGDICTICMENFVEHILISKTPCEHIFHKKCFDTYLKGVQKKDKLLCPNCNQNLLINKKYLKLRTKTKMIEIKQKINNNKDIKESENNFKNKNSIMTNKNEENIVSSDNNEIIFIKKRNSKGKNKIGENKNINKLNSKKKDEDNIYNPLQIRIRRNESYSKLDKDTIIPINDQNENLDKKEKDKILKRNIVFVGNFDKNNNSLKNALTNNESKTKLYNKKRKINLNHVNSEREGIMVIKKTCAAINSSSKQEN